MKILQKYELISKCSKSIPGHQQPPRFKEGAAASICMCSGTVSVNFAPY
jgi:hypothetical protein